MSECKHECDSYVGVLESQLSQAREELKEAHADCIRLQQEINCLRMEPCQLPKCVQARAELEKLKVRLDKKEGTICQNAEAWVRNHGLIAERNRLREERDTWQKMAIEREFDRDRLKAERDEAIGTNKIVENNLKQAMEDIGDLQADRDRLKAELDLLKREHEKAIQDCARIASENACHQIEAHKWKSLAEKAREFLCHDDSCILSQWSQGEPTPDGGYRTMYAGKWYQNRPVDETPKCDCGLDEILSLFPPAEEKEDGR